MKAQKTIAPRIPQWPSISPQTLVDLQNMVERKEQEKKELMLKISRLNDDLAALDFTLQYLEEVAG